MPFSMKKINDMLNIDKRNWKDAGSDALLDSGRPLGLAQLLFEKIDDEVIARQLQKLRDKTENMEIVKVEVAPLKSEVTFDDFSKLDIRVGKVSAAEKMEKSNKLLKLTIDIGMDKRTVVSGIAQHYSPEEMIGKQVTVIVNLAPRKMMGVESQGMVLMAEDINGKLKLLSPTEHVYPGAVVN